MISINDNINYILNDVIYHDTLSWSDKSNVLTNVLEPLISLYHDLGLTTIKPINDITADDLL